MVDINVEKVMNRSELSAIIKQVLTAGAKLLAKKSLSDSDKEKLKVITILNPTIKHAVSMVQQETMQQHHLLIAMRLKQLGYPEPKDTKFVTV